MPKKKKIEWEEVAKKGENLELILIDFVKEGFDLFFKSKAKKYPQGFYPTYYRQFAGARWLTRKEINQFINQIKNKEAQNPGFIFKGYLKYENILNKFREYSKSLLGQEVKNKTIPQLIAFIDRLRKQYGKMFAYAYNYYFYNRFLPDQLINILAQKESNPKLQAKYFEILASLDRPSETREEKEALLKLVGKIKKEHLTLKSKKLSELIQKHLNEYTQFGFYYFRGRSLTERDIKKRIRQWLKKDYQQELKNVAKQKQNAKESQRIMKKLKFDKKERILVKTLKQMAFCVQLFDENYNYFTYYSHPLWCEISRRLGITYNQMLNLMALEIKDRLTQREKISPKLKTELKQRAKDHALIWEKGKTRLLVGKKLRQYYKQELVKEKHIKIKEIKGQPASSGKAEGKVALVLDVKEIGKVKKGNIMVTPETVPSYVPAMEKAVAIVTDMGGLLSHAAIVSRELGIPCVVGTKIGTKVLKDGDRVEVDATKGIVKKL